MRGAVPALVLSLFLAALPSCDGGSAGPDGAPDSCVGSTGCGGVCATGNDFGVGMYCTPEGGECADTPGRMAPFCTGSQRPEADWFCTRPCDPDGDVVAQCGQDAACTGDGQGSPAGCVPLTCIE
jgi:hypothetical protein